MHECLRPTPDEQTDNPLAPSICSSEDRIHLRRADTGSLPHRVATDRTQREFRGEIDVSTGGQDEPNHLVVIDGDKRELGNPGRIGPQP